MSAVVKLPKDFLKKNPKAKHQNYPPYTGYSALHLGKFVNKQTSI